MNNWSHFISPIFAQKIALENSVTEGTKKGP